MDRTFFDTALARLNPAQRSVVESIYGSYMVVAGPGTGKTQVLSARTANILLSTDTAPENILITTFTEAWVAALKKRLFQFIGNASYRVHITTLHGLASDIISRYPEYFLRYRALRPMDELEGYEILEKVLRSGEYPTLSPPLNTLFYLRDIVGAIWKCREEGVDAIGLLEHTRRLEASHAAELAEIKPTLKKYATTQVAQAKELSKLRELASIFEAYTARKMGIGAYDFNDMIHHVASECAVNDQLAAELAEKYQFVMVDEFQDLSNSQSQLVEGILRGSVNPNILTVGDDDQSIYRFQGANLENMLHFSTKYPDTGVLVLGENYRSNTEILETASALISHNTTRLSKLIPSIVKPLVSARGDGWEVRLMAYTSGEAEMTGILRDIHSRLTSWAIPSDIAVLVRTNTEVRTWSELLRANGVPIQSNITSNLLDSDEYSLLRDIFRILEGPSIPTEALIELLRIGFFKCSRTDLYRMTRALEEVNYRLTRKMGLFEFILDDTLVEGIVGDGLSHWQGIREQILELRSIQTSRLSPQVESIIRSAKVSEFVRARSGISGLERLYALLGYIERGGEAGKFTSLTSILEVWERMISLRLRLPGVLAPRTEGVWVLTAHQSKGLEYVHVYIPTVSEGAWSNLKNKSNIKLPLSIVGDTLERADINEEERRLLFVAMTRAEKTLSISFPESVGARPKLPSLFVQELGLPLVSSDTQADPEVLLARSRDSYYDLTLEAEDLRFIERFFANYALSPTDLSRFLADPAIFLQRSILRYPFEDTLPTIFGTCYHRALEIYYKTWKTEKSRPDSSLLTETFEKSLSRYVVTQSEKTELLSRGREGLQGFYALGYNEEVLPAETEYSTTKLGLTYEGIPIKGKIDRIDEISPGVLRIIDYKTGVPKSSNALMGNTSTADKSYMRQLVFYKKMIESDPKWAGYRVDDVTIWYIEGREGKYPLEILPITPEIEAEFAQDLKTAWEQMTNPEWWEAYFASSARSTETSERSAETP